MQILKLLITMKLLPYTSDLPAVILLSTQVSKEHRQSQVVVTLLPLAKITN